jgi:two-component system, NtrC family, sensor kinase
MSIDFTHNVYKYALALCSIFILFYAPVSSKNKFFHEPTREGMFAIFETAAGYDIAPYNIAETIDEINEIEINEKKYKKLLKSKSQELGFSATVLGWQAVFNGKYNDANTYFETNLKVRKKVGDPFPEATARLYYGFSLYQSLNYEEAAEQFDKCVKISIKNNYHNLYAVVLALLGQTDVVAHKHDDAKQRFEAALSIFYSLGFEREQAVLKVEIAELLVRDNKMDSAMTLLNEALEIFIEIDDVPMQGIATRDIGLIHYKAKRYESALQAFRRSMAINPEVSVSKLVRDSYLKLYTLASLLQDHEKANEYHHQYLQLRDSIAIQENSRVMSSQLTRKELLIRDRIWDLLETTEFGSYDNFTTEELIQSRHALENEIAELEQEKIFEDLSAAKRKSDQLSLEREDRIEELTREKAIQEAALSKKELLLHRQSNVRNMLLIAVLFSIIIAFLLYKRFKQHRKSHQELDTAYHELSDTHTQLLSTQEQLVQSQKMASLGQMTAGVAHEIQNPLNFVNNFSELTLELVHEVQGGETPIDEAGPMIVSNIEKIHEHGKRADKIVKAMLIHSRASTPDLTAADINEVLDELISLAYHGSKQEYLIADVDIDLQFDKTIPKINISVGDLSRVFVNLFNNAFYSMGKKYESKGSEGYKPKLIITTEKAEIGIKISICDNGMGVNSNDIKKVFDPFFTTKPSGSGTGLGLSLSYEIITTGHNGTIDIKSEEGENCCFIITLPSTKKPQ